MANLIHFSQWVADKTRLRLGLEDLQYLFATNNLNYGPSAVLTHLYNIIINLLLLQHVR